MILNDKEIREKIEKGLITEYIDLEKQIAPQGFDLSVESIHKFLGPGRVDFSNKERIVPETEEIKWKEDEVFLEKGVYKIRSKERVELPSDIMGIARPRSTVLRCGSTVQTGVWDAGFKGKSEFLLIVGDNGLKLKKFARVIQIVFFKINKVEKEYDGIYKN